MKLFAVLIFLSLTCFGQEKIVGTVLDPQGFPIQDVRIFASGASYNTFSDIDGKFELNVAKGSYEITFRLPDYSSASVTYNTDKPKRLSLVLRPETELNELVITPMDDEEWRRNLALFKKNFLGTSALSKNCRITNERSIKFSTKNQKLRAFSSEPLKIKSSSLGYEVVFYLDDFEIDFNTKITFFNGTSYFNPLGNRPKKKWIKNRKQAYLGSSMHLARSMFNSAVEKNGFVLRRIKREPNTSRPSQFTIDSAREVLLSQKLPGQRVMFDLNSPIAKILRKAKKEPRFIRVLYTDPLKPSDYLIEDKGDVFWSFEDWLEIEYQKSEDRQVIYLNDTTQVYANGNMVPTAMISVEGSWTIQKVCDMLPLDYKLD